MTSIEKNTDWRLRATSPHAGLVPPAWIRCKPIPRSLWKVFVLVHPMEYEVPCQRTVFEVERLLQPGDTLTRGPVSLQRI